MVTRFAERVVNDLHEVEALKEAQRETGCRLAVGFNRRYAPIYRMVKEATDAHGAHNIHLRMADDAWRWAKNYPPGFLMGLDAGHLFDLLRWLTSSEVVQVSCMSSRPDDDSLLLKMSNGAVASIMVSAHGSMDMPKERYEVMGERGGVIAEDFVELRTYGYEDQPHRTCFEGHSHPDNAYLHKPMFRHLGAEGLASLRRGTWEERQRLESQSIPSDAAREELEAFVEKTIPNFLKDQGWLASMEAFVQGLLQGTATEHAGVEDAAAALRVRRAAEESRRRGTTVEVM